VFAGSLSGWLWLPLLVFLNAILHPHLAEFGPVRLIDHVADDPRRFHEVRRKGCGRLREMSRLDVRGPGVAVSECLDEHVLGRVIEAARPLEPQVAGLPAGGVGERFRESGPVVCMFGSDTELRGYENHPPIVGHRCCQVWASAAVTNYTARHPSRPSTIAAGADGALWFTNRHLAGCYDGVDDSRR
jgi:hypothetical protein